MRRGKPYIGGRGWRAVEFFYFFSAFGELLHVWPIYPAFTLTKPGGRCGEMIFEKLIFNMHPVSDRNAFRGAGIGGAEVTKKLRNQLRSLTAMLLLLLLRALHRGVGMFGAAWYTAVF